jgi:cytochrome c553
MTARQKVASAVVFGVLVVAGLGPTLFRGLLGSWEKNSILRGQELAAAEGCFGCHLPPSSAEIPNPGSRWGTVPRFRGGNALMYGSTRGEVEEIIRFGTQTNTQTNKDVEASSGEPQRVLMPAFGAHLSDDEMSDLLDYVTAEERVDLPGDADAQAGRELARQNGCTACHGIEGAGGIANPSSLGGFVPGFLGHNFLHLVHDRAEFGEWVRNGSLERLAKNPIVSFFWRHQRLSMPAYDTLSEQEIDQLWAWVQAMRDSSSP